MATLNYLAVDFGASSGRAVLGSFDGSRLDLHEVHRFPNGPVERSTGLHWDAPGLFNEVKRGLSLARRAIAGVGIDTWGVDYGLLSPSGELLALPRHYRDPRMRGVMDEAFRVVPREQIYARTGIQFLPFNTLYQLLADQRAGAGDAQGDNRLLGNAQSLLFIPDLLNYWLTGGPAEREPSDMPTERTIASTSQLYDTTSHAWAQDLVDAFGLPARILPRVVQPGTAVGKVASSVADEAGLGHAAIPVIAPASHDTASAVVAAPAVGDASDWAYISSGTWSLVGRELTAPRCSAGALAANFTNECGACGTTRFQKNVAGLWLLQECQRIWAEQGRRYTYEELREQALAAPPLGSLVDPDDPSFGEFADMPSRIREFCARTSQPLPATDGGIARCILESVAMKCSAAVDALESLTGPIRRIHLIGGGTQNTLLCQFTANAAQRPVIAGPVEATAAGNVMVQALAQGKVASLAEIRAVVAASFPLAHYEPRDADAWSKARDSFKRLVIGR